MTTLEKEKFMQDVTSSEEIKRLQDSAISIAWNITSGEITKEEAIKFINDLVGSGITEYFKGH